MVKRILIVAVAALVLTALPLRAGAQQGGQAANGEIQDDGVVPYVTVDSGNDDPYLPLEFETSGVAFPSLDPQIVTESNADETQLAFASVEDLGGFQDAIVGATAWSSLGVPLTGIAAPDVPEGSLLSTRGITATPGTGPTLPGVESAIPEVGGGGTTTALGDGRTGFAFTDDTTGELIAPPDDLPPVENPPAPPSEGIDAGPATTTTTAPAALPGTTAPLPPTTTAPLPPTTTEPSPPPAPATTTTTTTLPPVTTTTLPPTTTTTTTTRPPTTTTTTRPPTTTTTTTRPPTTTTTTTTLPPTTTTTTPPPAETFSLTQERPQATACVAPSTGGTQGCNAIWSVSLAATGDTLSFDLTLKNSGNTDASALQVWAGAACATTSTALPSGSGDLCSAVRFSMQRYPSAARDVPLECVYGGGTAQVCSLSASRTLADFSSTYPSANDFQAIGSGLQDGESSHLRLTLELPDVDNRYQRRAATISLTWRQAQ